MRAEKSNQDDFRKVNSKTYNAFDTQFKGQ